MGKELEKVNKTQKKCSSYWISNGTNLNSKDTVILPSESQLMYHTITPIQRRVWWFVPLEKNDYFRRPQKITFVIQIISFTTFNYTKTSRWTSVTDKDSVFILLSSFPNIWFSKIWVFFLVPNYFLIQTQQDKSKKDWGRRLLAFWASNLQTFLDSLLYNYQIMYSCKRIVVLGLVVVFHWLVVGFILAWIGVCFGLVFNLFSTLNFRLRIWKSFSNTLWLDIETFFPISVQYIFM